MHCQRETNGSHKGIKNQNDKLVDSNPGIQNKAMEQECLQNSQGNATKFPQSLNQRYG